MTPEERRRADRAAARLRHRAHERHPARPRDPRDRRRERQGRRRQVDALGQPRGGVRRSSGQRTGILDADVYGHSIPHLLGIDQTPVAVDRMIVPPVRGELKLMSIGFFLDDNEPVMWRGPMLTARSSSSSPTCAGASSTPPDRHAARHRRRPDLARPAAPARRGRGRDDAAAARAGGRGARRADGPQDEHAPARRGREHERRDVRHAAAASGSRTSSRCRCSARVPLDRAAARVRRRPARRSSRATRTRRRPRDHGARRERSRPPDASRASGSAKSLPVLS